MKKAKKSSKAWFQRIIKKQRVALALIQKRAYSVEIWNSFYILSVSDEFPSCIGEFHQPVENAHVLDKNRKRYLQENTNKNKDENLMLMQGCGKLTYSSIQFD